MLDRLLRASCEQLASPTTVASLLDLELGLLSAAARPTMAMDASSSIMTGHYKPGHTHHPHGLASLLVHFAGFKHYEEQQPLRFVSTNSNNGWAALVAAAYLQRTHGTAPFLGLCFATPVRSPSREDVSTLSDWKLTAEEFEARRRAQAEAEAAIACHADVKRCLYDSGDENLRGIPHVEESSASSVVGEGEEETITSASYFEAKYSHVVQTTPPMPLYDENRILVSESREGEILRLVERRKEQRRRARGGGGGGRTTPPDSKRTTPPRSKPPASPRWAPPSSSWSTRTAMRPR